MAFIDNLRMAGIFGGGTPMGMPDLSAGSANPDQIVSIMNKIAPFIENSKQKDRDFQTKMFDMQRQAHLQDIGQNLTQQQQIQKPGPMNVVYQPSMSDYQKAQIGLKKEDLGLKRELGTGKLDVQSEGNDIRQQRADVYDRMHDLTDAEKLDIMNNARQNDIESRGNIQRQLLGTKGNQTLEQIGARIAGSRDLQNNRNEAALNNINARTAGQRELQDTKPTKPLLPNQVNIEQNRRARQMMNTNPALAPFIKFDDKGNVNIEQPSTGFFGNKTGPTPEQMRLIQDYIYNAPPDTTTDNTSQKKANNIKKSQSKYAVTIE